MTFEELKQSIKNHKEEFGKILKEQERSSVKNDFSNMSSISLLLEGFA